MLSKIITETINLESKDKNGNNVLHQAVLDNNVELVALILERLENDVDGIINSQNNKGETPFFIAVKNENSIIAEMLDLAGADKSIKNNNDEYIININNNDDFVLDDEEVVDFKFPIVKCKKNADNADLTEILFKLSNLNTQNKLPTSITESETYPVDKNSIIDIEYLNRLMDQYLILKRLKKQEGGKRKRKIIYGSRKI